MQTLRRQAHPPVVTSTYQAGLFGEEVVCDLLESDGWRIVGHRVRTRWGELDVIAQRGDLIVFAEVKTAGVGRLAPVQAVDSRAQHRLRRAAVAWMATNARLQRGVSRYRFDVFVVYRDETDVLERVEHIADAF